MPSATKKRKRLAEFPRYVHHFNMTPSFRDITPRLFAIPAWSTPKGEWVSLLHPEDADDWLDREFRITGRKFPADMKPDGALHEPGHVYLSFQREDSDEIEAIVMLMAGQDTAGIALDLPASPVATVPLSRLRWPRPASSAWSSSRWPPRLR